MRLCISLRSICLYAIGGARARRKGRCILFNTKAAGNAVLGLRAHQTTNTFPDLATLGKVAQEVGNALQYTVQQPLRARYAAAMTARFSYFLGQGIGVALSGINEGSAKQDIKEDTPTTQASTRTLDPVAIVGALTDAILSDTAPTDYSKSTLENVRMDEKPIIDGEEQRALFAKNFQAIVGVIKTDLKNIEDGKYKFPYDLELSYSPQWSPSPVLSQLNIYLNERVKVIDRMLKRDGFEIRRNLKVSKGKYPQYYLQNFHFQSDGWLSARSATIYDYQVESLFLGMADAMRRQVLPHFTSYVKSLKATGRAESDITVLDVATGTGRFASFMLDNFPGLKLDALDLSPFYLAESKKLLNKFKGVTYVEAAAEDVPAKDNSYDIVTCIYLFHELPEAIRAKVVKEWFRVLKPGGKIFFVDSAQEGEVPYDRVLEGFTIIAHEPYYINYTKQDLVKLFQDQGFSVDTTEVHWVSKCLVATKPLHADAAATAAVSAELVDAVN